jgi:hypothetical protein
MKIHTTLGITVAALALAFVGNVSAEAPANASAEQKPESKALDVGSMNITICYEAFSLPIAKAGELQRKRMTDEELYKEVVKAGKIERLLVLRTKSGQRAVVESVTEHRYPSEFTDGCTLFHDLAKAKEGENGQKVIEVTKPNVWPIIPTSTEKRDVGDTLEIEPTVSDEGSGVNFQICVTHVAQSKREKWGKGLAEFEQPQYETQKLSTNAAASFKSPCFIGTLSPPFGNGLAARTEQKAWFCFITATAPKNADAVTGKSAK